MYLRLDILLTVNTEINKKQLNRQMRFKYILLLVLNGRSELFERQKKTKLELLLLRYKQAVLKAT